MRKLLVLAVAVVSLGVGSGAFAKDKKPAEDEGVIPTGIKSFDRVFTRVGEIDGRLDRSEKSLRTSKGDLNTALDLKRNAPVSTALSQLRTEADGKVKLAMDGKVPKLQATDAVPTNVQNALDAVNAMTANFSTSVEELQGLVPEINQLVKDTRTMPASLKDEFAKGSDGLLDQLLKLPKASKALTHDISIAKGLPGRTTSLTNEMTSTLNLVTSEFGGGGGSKPSKPSKPAPGGKPATKPGAKAPKKG